MSNRMFAQSPSNLDIVSRMDLRQLEMFLAVADQASFTRAGQQLHVAQSAVSRKIALLEDELGERLFQRGHGKVYLTSAGQTLLRHARKIFQEMRDATMEVSDIAQLQRGKLRIGAGMIACAYLLPPVLEKFKDLYPRVDLEVVSRSTEALTSQLQNNLLDLGVFTLPIRFPDLEVVRLCSEEMVVVTSPKHPVLSRKRTLLAKELANHRLIIFGKEAYTRKVLDDFFRDCGIVPQIYMEAENVAVIKPLVRINMGITILPLRAVQEEARRNELHYLRIGDYKLSREQGLVFQKSDHLPKGLSELIRLFVEETATAASGRVRHEDRASAAQ